MSLGVSIKQNTRQGFNIKSLMQRVAKALMIPIVILPFAAIFLAIGEISDIDFLHVAGNTIIRDYLPLLFAVGFAISFTDNDGFAAFAAICGHVTMARVMTSINPGITLEDGTLLPNDMSVLGGIIVGVYTTILYRKFKNIKFPEFLGLFSGKRFIPIITAITGVLFGVVFGYIWPPINNLINNIAIWIFNTGEVGVFFYGVLNRLLIPTGLHHIQSNILEHVLGSFVVDGAVVTGELARFYAGDITAGFYTGGFFVLMGFALPAAALAMYHEAKTENKKKVAGVMLTVALTSIVTGITEPLEFMFMFTAPLLFAAHAVLTGAILSGSYMLGIRHYGYAMPMFFVNIMHAERPWLIFPLGVFFAFIYYVSFRFLIRKFNYLTPGREDVPITEREETNLAQLPAKILQGLGNSKNIAYLDACVTRLRVTIHDGNLIDIKFLEKLPLSGISKLDNTNYQLIFGYQSEKLKDEILALINAGDNKKT